MITKYCRSCGTQVVIDENKDRFFCSNCGAENIVNRINSGIASTAVSQTAVAMPFASLNSPNIFFDYTTTVKNVKMLITVTSTGEQYVFAGGEGIKLHLPEGTQVIKFKIGDTTYTKNITVQNGLMIHITCSWSNGQLYFFSDFPQFIADCATNHPGNTKSNSGIGLAIGISITVLVLVILLSSIFSYLNKAKKAHSSNTSDASNGINGNTNTVVSTSEVTVSSTELSKDSFIESCTELDFKDVARNPDKYIGQNFYFICYVSSVRTGGLFSGYQRYFITYEFDLDKAQQRVEEGRSDSISDARIFCYDTDICVWMFDNRDETSPDYIKVLENDIVIVYGTFNGLTESQNSLTGETSEEVSLDVKYVELVSD